ncbi:MAG: zinc ribbon domain-containing protein [Dehalococcoidia bacterium]|nr:zinc ribbon domain-containing protein [Dehalococcoidia bacterium]
MEYAILGGLVGGVWALLLWLSIIVWVYRDVRERTRDLGLQVLAVFVVMMFFPGFNIPGLALYLMLRPRESLEEAYARSLEEEALLREIGDEGVCPSCRRFVERGWKTCPFCQTQLKDVCRQCAQLLSFAWLACPYCGTPRPAPAQNAPERMETDAAAQAGAPQRPPARAGDGAAAQPAGEETLPSSTRTPR